MADQPQAHQLAQGALRELQTIARSPLSGVVEQLARGLALSTSPSSTASKREALLRAIGAWADARERYAFHRARCLDNDPLLGAALTTRDAAHVEMLRAIDALEGK